MQTKGVRLLFRQRSGESVYKVQNILRTNDEMGIKSGLGEFLIVSNPVQGKGSDVLDSQEQVRFETLVLPHLDAAFNLARWLLRSRADAEDAAQEALLRAYRFFHGFHGRECPGLASANRPEYLLHLARQKSQGQRYDRIQRRSARAPKPIA